MTRVDCSQHRDNKRMMSLVGRRDSHSGRQVELRSLINAETARVKPLAAFYISDEIVNNSSKSIMFISPIL